MKIKIEVGDDISNAASKAVNLVGNGESEVTFDFNGIELSVRAGMTVEDVCAEYDRTSTARYEAYIATPEYKARQAEVEARDRRKQADYQEAIARTRDTMTILDAEAWEQIKRVNSENPYSNRCVTYAEEWARLMEVEIEANQTVAQCASRCSHVADHDGITGFMYGMAVSILAKVWRYGEELRRWHNKDVQIGIEGDRANQEGGVLNPALLSIE